MPACLPACVRLKGRSRERMGNADGCGLLSPLFVGEGVTFCPPYLLCSCIPACSPLHPIALHFSIPSSANRWLKQVARLLLPLLHALTTAAAATHEQQRARAMPCLRNLHNRRFGLLCSDPFVCLYACMQVSISVHVYVPLRTIVDYSSRCFSSVSQS